MTLEDLSQPYLILSLFANTQDEHRRGCLHSQYRYESSMTEVLRLVQTGHAKPGLSQLRLKIEHGRRGPARSHHLNWASSPCRCRQYCRDVCRFCPLGAREREDF